MKLFNFSLIVLNCNAVVGLNVIFFVVSLVVCVWLSSFRLFLYMNAYMPVSDVLGLRGYAIALKVKTLIKLCHVKIKRNFCNVSKLRRRPNTLAK